MAEYIDREELMKFPIRRNHYDKEHGNEDFICGIETVLEYAENLQTTDIIQEWISVDDRLPEQGERVLATDGGFVGELYVNSRCQWQRYNVNDHSLMMSLDILWWMPLPLPPKGE